MAIAHEGGVTPVSCRTSRPLRGRRRRRRVRCAGSRASVTMLAVSARTGAGCGQIGRDACASGCHCGATGIKRSRQSTLLNRILGAEVNRTARSASPMGVAAIPRTRRQLIDLPSGGALIDTPGLREIQLWVTEDSFRRSSTTSRSWRRSAGLEIVLILLSRVARSAMQWMADVLRASTNCAGRLNVSAAD